MNNATQELAAALEEAEKQSELRDFYDIGLFGYCEGEKHGSNFKVDFCSKPAGSFWFNPLVVWHLNVSGVHDLFPSHLQSNLQTYQKVSHWMFVAYVLAFATTVIQLLVGISAIFSRIGSIFTTIVSAVSPNPSYSNSYLITNNYTSQVATGFLIAANITSTALFVTLVGVFNSSLKEYGVKSDIGANAFAASWLALGLSMVSTFFWLFSSCCCSGRSAARRPPAQGSYEKVDFANGGGAASHHGHTTAPAPTFANTNTAYEPYRHQ